MSLLPSSSSRLMHVLAECLCDRLAAVPCPGPEAMRPETAPASFVPFLAWGWSVDLWDRDWPIERKRAITRDALEMHRLKGTEAGIRRYLDYTAARDVVITTPPQDFFASLEPDEDPSWRRWLESLPEIRVYSVQTPSAYLGGIWSSAGDIEPSDTSFFGDEAGEATMFFGGAVPASEVEYAVMVAGGETSAIGMTRRADPRRGQRGDVLDFWLPETDAGTVLDDGSFDADLFFDDGGVGRAALSVAFGPSISSGGGWALAEEQVDHIQDVEPESGAYEVISLGGLFAGADFWGDAILDRVDETIGTYRAVRLLRPGVTLPPAASFWGDRLGLAPYTAEIRVALPEVAGPGIAHLNAGCFGATFWASDPDLGPLHFVCDAIEAAQGLRDRVLLDLDIPVPRRSLKSTRRLSQLSLG